ncbi:MAG: hypothetical protein R3331_05290 [Sulfurospirillaceae bacterium]|nr:hypothetical protein [Sulfurospirillaceae bacterium]
MKKIVLVSLLSSIAAFALQVHPIPVEIQYGKKYKEFTIADDNGKYQAYIKKWTQDTKGEEVLENTNEVVVYPRILQAPKKIKVYNKRSNLIPQEKSYRLILRELNINKFEGQTRVLKTLSIPVFILPKFQKPKLELSCKGHALQIKNSGNMHYKILSITDKKMNEYVLPNHIKEVDNVRASGTIETNHGNYAYRCESK